MRSYHLAMGEAFTPTLTLVTQFTHIMESNREKYLERAKSDIQNSLNIVNFNEDKNLFSVLCFLQDAL